MFASATFSGLWWLLLVLPCSVFGGPEGV